MILFYALLLDVWSLFWLPKSNNRCGKEMTQTEAMNENPNVFVLETAAELL